VAILGDWAACGSLREPGQPGIAGPTESRLMSRLYVFGPGHSRFTMNWVRIRRDASAQGDNIVYHANVF
jgi:hypothetical protein